MFRIAPWIWPMKGEWLCKMCHLDGKTSMANVVVHWGSRSLHPQSMYLCSQCMSRHWEMAKGAVSLGKAWYAIDQIPESKSE